MQFHGWRSAVAVFSLLSRSHAIEPKSSLHSLDVRQNQQTATCIYATSSSADSSERRSSDMEMFRNTYSFVLDLPGAAWQAMCSEQMMGQTLRPMKLRCHEIWTRDGSSRAFKDLRASMVQGQCRVIFRITADSRLDDGYPELDDDCLMNPKPEPCGIASQDLPWPSNCPRMKKAPFTDKEDERLLALREQCLTFEQIAEEMPWRTPVAWRTHYGAIAEPAPEPQPPYTPEQYAFLRRLRDRGLSWEGIANRFAEHYPNQDRSQQALESHYRWLFQKRACKPRWPEMTPEDDERLRQMKEEGRLWREISEAFPDHDVNWLMRYYYEKLEPDPLTRPPRPYRKPYWDFTPRDDARIRRMREKGKPWAEIQEAFEHRWGNVMTYYHTVVEPDPSARPPPPKGQSGSLWSPEENTLLRALKNEGLKWDEIKDRFPGRTKGALQAQYARLLEEDKKKSRKGKKSGRRQRMRRGV